MHSYSSIPPEELVSACANSGDSAAWEEFVRRFQKVIATVALRTAREWGNTSAHLIDDLVQETYFKLCADNCCILRNFQARHSGAIFGYLKVITANVVHDHFKALNSRKRGENLTSVLGEDCEVGEISGFGPSEVELMERAILIEEIDTSLRTFEVGPNAERDRRIFWLYYRAGLPASAIASISGIGLTTKGVESTLLRLTQHVKQKLCRAPRISGERDPDDKGIQPAESF